MRQNAITAEVAAGDAGARTTEEVQVLEFQLGQETYCVDIEHVSEIVDKGQLTGVPNAPTYVEGVMDLRGRTTSIIDPRALLAIDATAESKRIVIFDPTTFEDEAATGWLVDEVYQVVRVSMDDVEDPPLEQDDTVEGVIKRDGELVIWISPRHALA
jgi:purine-binding chemotaxis protein CheW